MRGRSLSQMVAGRTAVDSEVVERTDAKRAKMLVRCQMIVHDGRPQATNPSQI